jgi:phosphatidylserine decarboxylase
MEISYIDRKTKQKCIEKVFGHRTLSFLYGDGWLRSLFSSMILPLLAHVPFFSRFYGWLKKRPSSAKKVDPFIQVYGIDSSEFVETKFRSFNDFFIRKLKPECRPIVSDPNCLVMPADGRYFVYSHFDHFVVKGKEFILEEFLQDPVLARRFVDGSMVIARLCPIDYHRFHFPCDGIPSKARLINGALYSVSPIALKKRLQILAENKRMVTEIETEAFGTMLCIEIGATAVGTIRQTFSPEKPVKKGDEKGYFEFGGSCIVLLFEKDRVVFDSDLIENTRHGLETRSNFGESLGKRVRVKR